DIYFFGDYVWVHDLRTALAAAFEPLFGQRSYVRPIPLLMLYAEVIASNRNPAVSHSINLAIHWICSALVFFLARRAIALTHAPDRPASPWTPLLLASIFSVHPALSEAPIWISSRFDLMATLWVLLALWVAGLAIRDRTRALLLGLLFFIGALCKESVAIFPLLLGVHALLKGSQTRPKQAIQLCDAFTVRELKAYAALVGFGIVYLFVRHHVMSEADLLQVARPTPAEWLSLVTVSISKYLQLTAMPFVGSSPHHTWAWPQDGSLASFWQAHMIALSFLAMIAILVLRRRPSGWWLLAWLAAYLPVLHLIPLPIGQNAIHQRFMYLPTAILLAFAPYVLARLRISEMARRASTGLLALMIIISIPIDRSIVRVWRNDLALWTWTTRAQPTSVEARENLVWAYLRYDMYEEAEKEFLHIVRQGVRTSPSLAVNMGTAMYRQGEFEGALHYYHKAEQHTATFNATFRSRLLANLGITNAILGNEEEAKSYLIKSLLENRRNLTAIGHLIGYCQGNEIDTSIFDPEDVQRAKESALTTADLVRSHQPSLQAKGAFCPDL
ncbi:hypothetical protein ABD76_00160, partial [Paenibacillus dendritiformis]|uniref:tetratricopeptide repeat protein n=1 Tax=Paenibacillus dendritiformis TaxID=130049 RepID=UPI0018CDF7C7